LNAALRTLRGIWAAAVPWVPSVPGEDRQAFRIDVVSAVAYGLFMGFQLPFIPVLLKRLGASPLELGLSVAAPYLSFVLAFPFYRYLRGFRALDINSVPTFFSRLAVASIGFLAEPRAILAVFLVSQFLEGLGMAAYVRILKSMYSEGGRSRAMGLVRAALSFAMIVGATLGGPLIDAGQMWLPFLLAGLCGAMSSVSFLRLFPRATSPIFAPKALRLADMARTLRSSAPFRWMNLTMLLFGLGNLLIVGVLPTLLVDRFDISHTALGTLNGVQNFLQIVGYVLLGSFVNRFGAQAGMLAGLFFGVLNPLLFMWAPRVAWLAIPYATTGLMMSAFDLCWPLLLLVYADEDQIAAYSGVYILHLGLRGLVATVAANLLLPTLGTDFFLQTGAVLTVAGLAVGWGSRRRWSGKP
jgi:predicted MFS family arabinose efflux permease